LEGAIFWIAVAIHPPSPAGISARPAKIDCCVVSGKERHRTESLVSVQATGLEMSDMMNKQLISSYRANNSQARRRHIGITVSLADPRMARMIRITRGRSPPSARVLPAIDDTFQPRHGASSRPPERHADTAPQEMRIRKL
jgi:hypothetical protein